MVNKRAGGPESAAVLHDRLDRDVPLGAVSRRNFLAASGIAVAFGTAGVQTSDASLPPPDALVLQKTDLAEPEGEYVQRPGANGNAKLVRQLKSGIPGFRHTDLAVSGFSATADETVPKYVESAVFDLPPDVHASTVALETRAWLLDRYEGSDNLTDFSRTLGSLSVEWRSDTANGWQDVFRISQLGDSTLAFTVAYGRTSTDPQGAVDRYTRTMRERAHK